VTIIDAEELGSTMMASLADLFDENTDQQASKSRRRSG
jgi:hypothetical protein